MQSPIKVYTWAAYNGILLALIPYVVFRMRLLKRATQLEIDKPENDVLVIVVVLACSAGLDTMGSNIFQLTRHQQLVGGLMSFWLHLFGTDLPIMIVIYSILMPRLQAVFADDGLSAGSGELSHDAYFRVGHAVRLDWRGCDVADFRLLVVDSGWLDEVVSDMADRERVGACVGVSRNFTACDGGYALDCE